MVKGSDTKSMNVAVLMSVYGKDNPLWFEEALLSIFNQKFDGTIRLYLGVDGPLSSELEMIISKFQSKIFKIVRSPENLGLTKMLNQLLDSLQGEEFIFRADSDDICEPERFRKQICFMHAHPEVDVVGSAIRDIDEKGRVLLAKVRYPLTHEGCKAFFKKRDPLAHPAVLFRSRFFVKAGHYNPDYRTDQDSFLWLQGFLHDCRFANIDEVLLSFRRSSKMYDRRSGMKRARQMINLRLLINRSMNYSLDAYVYAFLIGLLTIFPPGLKRLMYQKLR